MKAGGLCERHKNVCISAPLMAACKNPSALLKKRVEEVPPNEADIHGRSGFPLKGKWRAQEVWQDRKLQRNKKKKLEACRTVPLRSGTALLWICRCRWEPRGRRLVSGPGAGAGRGGSTFHWVTGWSPPPGSGSAARTTPSGSLQGPALRPLPGPRLTWSDRVLWTDGQTAHF